MYKHILIPTDGSELSVKAIKHGVQLAKSVNARVTAMTVSPTFHRFSLAPNVVTDTPEQYRSDRENHAKTILATAEEAARTAEIPFESVHVFNEHPYQAIIETAQRGSCDLICMASHGRKGVAALVLGSETMKVLTHSKIPVLVCR